jgi:Tol biopolymer transport system component
MMLMSHADASRDRHQTEWLTPVNLGADINTPFSEAAPAISRDGLTLYFVSNRPGVAPEAFGDNDLYVARRERVNDPWGVPVNLGATINTAGFDGFPALSQNEHHLFFSRAPGDLWVSHRTSTHHDFGVRGWQEPVPLGPGVNTSESEVGPAFFDNDKRGVPQLFFSAMRSGSALNDIYMAEAFGSARPVEELNSPDSEVGPSITADGLEIFFHSNRVGSAGNDMYSSRRKSVFGRWSEPRTLGPVVNSVANDSLGTISPDGETLWFTSMRDGGFGSNDLYMTTRTNHRRR